MNTKMYNNVVDFYNSVGDYINLEYGVRFHKAYFKDSSINNLFDKVAAYYMGGNNVPDTARMIVDYIKSLNRC